jgi:hypothetical protein
MRIYLNRFGVCLHHPRTPFLLVTLFNRFDSESSQFCWSMLSAQCPLGIESDVVSVGFHWISIVSIMSTTHPITCGAVMLADRVAGSEASTRYAKAYMTAELFA